MKDFEQNHGYPEGKTHYARWDIREEHPINIGRNLFGVASCMAFFKIIFQFEIHYKFGPILFCIKQVRSNIFRQRTFTFSSLFTHQMNTYLLAKIIYQQVVWDIAAIVGLYLITMFSFCVGLVSIFGLYHGDATKFSGFEQTFKTLFWIIFDPGSFISFRYCFQNIFIIKLDLNFLKNISSYF